MPFEASPQPKLLWTWNGERVLPQRAQVQPDVAKGLARVQLKKVEPGDAGVYKLTAENPVGEATLEVRVKVIDVPSAPQNLQAECEETLEVTLAWNVPESDGGAEITDYVVEKKEAGARTWSPVTSVSASDLSFVVKSLPEGKRYELSVSAVNCVGKSEPCTLKEPVTIKKPYGELSKRSLC